MYTQAYASLSGTAKDFGYKVGLRAESSEYDGTLLTDNTNYSNYVPHFFIPFCIP